LWQLQGGPEFIARTPPKMKIPVNIPASVSTGSLPVGVLGNKFVAGNDVNHATIVLNLFQDTPPPATPSKPEEINQSQSTIQEPELQPEPEQLPPDNTNTPDNNPVPPSDDTPPPPPGTPPSEARPQPSATNEVLDDTYKSIMLESMPYVTFGL
jgi:hypothetical protein